MNKYMTSENNGTYTLKLSGELRYTDSGPFDNYIQLRIQQDNHFVKIVVDLTDATFMDSTNLGLLAGLAVFNLQKNGSKMEIRLQDGDIAVILESSGFKEISTMIFSTGNGKDDWQDLSTDHDEPDLRQTMLKAHETLANMNESNKMIFQDVVEALKASSD